jgi:hypothetical protein
VPEEDQLTESTVVERHLGSIAADLHQIRRTQVLFRWVLIVLIALYGLMALILLSIAGLMAVFGSDTSTPAHYEVGRIDGSSGPASVSYLDPETGERVTRDVVLPWQSESWSARDDDDLYVSGTGGDGGRGITCSIVGGAARNAEVMRSESDEATCAVSASKAVSPPR